MMIKVSIQKEDIMILNLYTPNIAQNTWRKTKRSQISNNLIPIDIKDILKDNKDMYYVNKYDVDFKISLKTQLTKGDKRNTKSE